MMWNNNVKNIKQLLELINQADALVLGIGSGMTAADGIGYTGTRFEQNFSDFIEKFKFLDMLQASVYHFENIQNYWAFHSRFMELNYFNQLPSQSFINLKKFLDNKNFFIITTNSDNALEAANFDDKKIFYIQGKYNLLQCKSMCHNKRYSMDNVVRQMIHEQKNMLVPLEIIPHCPVCGDFLEVNKRLKEKGMVEDEQFFIEKQRYLDFIDQHKNKKILFWEIGVGYSTPMLIKHPFWNMTQQYPNSLYVAMNNRTYRIPNEIKNQTIVINTDIKHVIENLIKEEDDFSRTN
ncbi:deacetylase SIR2 [Mycoplasmopsis phocirhinis]|uniref:Deacetylase SIR2 n=1 Tax=Mycoplasmopsis phocirhinis TaxID=142650 RepID=A0A4P6MU11_9BACT|nr:deacetylase SIR2 [Mycoplasmopsis phocirhinis]QBF34897.1 deacetylase SIR2 [Mycoplasmopsis phocirhinis]